MSPKIKVDKSILMNHDVKIKFFPYTRIIWEIYCIDRKLACLGNGNLLYDVLYIHFLDFNYPCYALFMSHKAVVYQWRMKHREVQCGIYTLKIRCHFVIIMGHTVIGERSETEELQKAVSGWQKIRIRWTLIKIKNLERWDWFTERNQCATCLTGEKKEGSGKWEKERERNWKKRRRKWMRKKKTFGHGHRIHIYNYLCSSRCSFMQTSPKSKIK